MTHYEGFMLNDSRKMISQASFTMQNMFMLVCFLFICSHGRTLQRPGETCYIILYIYEERKETERRRDTEMNIERGKGFHYILAIMYHITKELSYMIAEI